jgi:hypothetical protein
MTHNHTRATNINWEKKRSEIMTKLPPIGDERGIFYPIFMLPN